MPKLSVIVPIYNTEKYLRECIDSILAQTFTDFELILVNDGSTDGSGAICEEYAKKDTRIRVIHQENGGITIARKSGVRKACGEYITFVDSDDWVDRDMYATLLDCRYEISPDIIICGMHIETARKSVPRKKIITAGLYDKQRMRDELYPVMLFDFEHGMPAVVPSLCNKIFRKPLLSHVIGGVVDTITYGEDALCTYACLLDASWIYVTDLDLYHYRNHEESVCNGYISSLLEKFSLLISELHIQFQSRSFDMEKQLYGYAARHSLECIRSDLLYNKGLSYREKHKAIVAFLSVPMIQKSISYTISVIPHFKTRVKLILADKKWIQVLYAAYQIRNYLLTIKVHLKNKELRLLWRDSVGRN